MIRGIIPAILLCLLQAIPVAAHGAGIYNPVAVPICTQIILEMAEGKISPKEARLISLSIARAGNRHFGRITAGDMWLFMALVYVESGFRTNVVNYQNCRGMFQVHAPSWAGKFGLKYVDLLDPETNADCGVRIFKYYLELYKNVIPALSAYNSDHPRASVGYALAVLGARKKIMRRYVQLYQTIAKTKVVAASAVPFAQNPEP